MERAPEPAESAVEEPASQEPVLEAIAQRERELRQSLIEARDALLRRDEEIDRLQSELGARGHGSEVSSGGLGAASEVTGFEDKPTLEKKVKRLASELDARDRRLREQRMRIRRLQRSVPMRVRARVAALPGVRWIAARREKKFKRAVEAAHEPGTQK
jgi:seryl-tRNA synthetase